MYRVLVSVRGVRERRAQRRHPGYAKPELLARVPNQLWSWDITKLRGPVRGHWYALYVVLDVFSRCVVGWRLAERERGELAEELLRWCRDSQDLPVDGGLTVHADRGRPMTGKPVSALLVALGITRIHSRPHVPNDTPYSGAQFKTLKYHATFPGRFGSLEDAERYCTAFFQCYNTQHRHSGIGMHTPHDVHTGAATARQAARADVLSAAYARHPARFINRAPVPPMLPTEVWINKPPAALLTSAGQLMSGHPCLKDVDRFRGGLWRGGHLAIPDGWRCQWSGRRRATCAPGDWRIIPATGPVCRLGRVVGAVAA